MFMLVLGGLVLLADYCCQATHAADRWLPWCSLRVAVRYAQPTSHLSAQQNTTQYADMAKGFVLAL